jgi:hypothetical protein
MYIQIAPQTKCGWANTAAELPFIFLHSLHMYIQIALLTK